MGVRVFQVCFWFSLLSQLTYFLFASPTTQKKRLFFLNKTKKLAHIIKQKTLKRIHTFNEEYFFFLTSFIYSIFPTFYIDLNQFFTRI